MEAAATLQDFETMPTRKESRARGVHARIDAAFDSIAVRKEAQVLRKERDAYHQALRLGRDTEEFVVAVQQYRAAFAAYKNFLHKQTGADAAEAFQNREVERAAHATLVKGAGVIGGVVVGSIAYAKLVIVGGGLRAVAAVATGMGTSKFLKNGFDTKRKIGKFKIKWDGIGTVGKKAEANFRHAEAESRANGESYDDFVKNNAAVIAKRKNSKWLRFAARYGAGIGVSFGSSVALDGSLSQHASKAAEWLAHHIPGISEQNAELLANGDGSYWQMIHKISEALRSGTGAAFHVLGELFGITPANAQEFTPGPQVSDRPFDNNGGFHPGPQVSDRPFNHNQNYHGGYRRQGNFRIDLNFGDRHMRHPLGWVDPRQRPLGWVGPWNGGDYNGQDAGIEQNGDGYWTVDQYGRQVWIEHTGHVVVGHHEEGIVRHARAQEHNDCVPSKATETRIAIPVDHTEKTLHTLGTDPFAGNRNEAFDTAHINKLIDQLRIAGKSPEFLAALKQSLITEGKLHNYNTATLNPHAKFAWMASGHDLMSKGVQLDTKNSYTAEEWSFRYTDAQGNLHEVTIDKPDKVGNNVGCENIAQANDEIIKQVGVDNVCAPTEGTLNTNTSGESVDAIVGKLQSDHISMDNAVSVLRAYGDPTTHDLLNRDYAQSHLDALSPDQKKVLWEIEALVKANKHVFVSEQEYTNLPASEALSRINNR